MNFTIAAEILYITQPVLSRHIKVLENEIGVKIFMRTRQSV
ncbi:LysR family transcriptional regulator [Tissierellaceae bacterium BX21]|uniref:LysR family transcriptional regulator n=1 Tax=Paratissierella segnis TaxID=2763679 RepID=A0A926EWW9_9FIRM|nr:LysR family transcriptional regulator [Paratissierella segnis]